MDASSSSSASSSASAPASDAPVPSILAYTQSVQSSMPTAFYPGPAVGVPVSGADGDSDSDSDSSSDDDSGARTRKILLAVVLAIAVVLIIVILFYMFRPRTLSRALARCGWTVYLMKGCGYCQKQMGLLNGFDMYVLCDKGRILDGYTGSPPLSCNAIPAFPYWHNTRTGESRKGFQDAGALERMARL